MKSDEPHRLSKFALMIAGARHDQSSWTASTNSWNVELWPDPVETQKLLQKISAKIRKYIVLRPEALIATALWTMTAWAHEGATHSKLRSCFSEFRSRRSRRADRKSRSVQRDRYSICHAG